MHLLIAAPSLPMMNNVKDVLNSKYFMKDLGKIDNFLGMTITQTESSISLGLADYISRSATESSISINKTVSTPLIDIKPC